MQPDTIYFNEVVQFPRFFGTSRVFRVQRLWRYLQLLPRLRCLDMMDHGHQFYSIWEVDQKNRFQVDQLTNVSCIVFAYSSSWISGSNKNICGIFSIAVAWESLCLFVMSFYHPFFGEVFRCFSLILHRPEHSSWDVVTWVCQEQVVHVPKVVQQERHPIEQPVETHVHLPLAAGM